MKSGTWFVAVVVLAGGVAGAGALPACLDNTSNEVDSGPTEAPASGACFGGDNVFCFAWKNVPPSDIDFECAEADAGGGGIGTCPSANASGTCTTAEGDAGSTSVTSYAPVTSCTVAKAACQGAFVGNGC
jgi:hypothetical protein